MMALYDAILSFKCLRELSPKYLSSRFNTRASFHGETQEMRKLKLHVLYSRVQETVDWFLHLYPEAFVCVTGDLTQPQQP